MQLNGVVTITAPSAVDGRGEIAVLNDSTSANFVGYLFDASGFDGPNVRPSSDDIVEGHGSVFGSFYYGSRPFTLDVQLARAATWALSNARRDKLYRAMNAMAADGTVGWVEAGAVSRQVSFRREQPPRGPDKDGHVLCAGISADPRIYAGGSETTASASTSLTLTNAGNVSTPPRFTIASPSATVVITNTTTSQSLTFTGLSGGGTVTVDFKAKTITQGGVSKAGSISFPSSVWWELIPGSNSITVTNSATPFFRSAWL